MGNMQQEIAHSRGGCNSSCAFKIPGDMTSMIHIYMQNGSSVLRFMVLSGAPEWMDVLSGEPE